MTTLNSPSVWVLFQKNLPAPLRLLLRPWLAISLMLHGVWLLLPMPSDPPPVLEVPEDEQVSLTELPNVARSLPASPSAPPSPPKPSPQVSVVPSSKPVAAPIVTPAAPAIAPPAPTEVPTAAATPSPSPTNSPEATPTPSEVPPTQATPLPEETPPTTAWAAFPHPESVATCDGLENCWMAPQSRWQQLFQEFEQSLQAEGYVLNDITEQRLANTAGRRIFAIEKDNEPQYYLNMVSTPEGSTRYLNTEEPLGEAELDQLSGF